MSAEKRLKELNIILPESTAPAGSYAKVVILDGIAHLSGQGPRNSDGSPITCKIKNGSKAIATLKPYAYNWKGKTGVGTGINKLVITELIEYVPSSDPVAEETL